MKIKEIFQDLITNPLKFWIGHIIFFALFSIVLLIGQYYFLPLYESNSNILQYFVFKIDSISISSMYLSNFVNKNWDYFQTNIAIMWIGLVLIFLTEQRKDIFNKNIVFIFFIAPFIISLINIPILMFLSINGALGFSGIATIILGYGFYSIMKLFCNCLKEIPNLPNFFKIVLYSLFIVIFVGLIYFMTLDQTGTNIYIHIFGYFFGFFIGLLSHYENSGFRGYF